MKRQSHFFEELEYMLEVQYNVHLFRLMVEMFPKKVQDVIAIALVILFFGGLAVVAIMVIGAIFLLLFT